MDHDFTLPTPRLPEVDLQVGDSPPKRVVLRDFGLECPKGEDGRYEPATLGFSATYELAATSEMAEWLLANSGGK